MEIQKVGNISRKEFLEEFYKPGIPCVLTGASKIWKANGLFSPDYFRKNFGQVRTTVGDKEYNMAELLDWIENSTPDNPVPYPAKFNIPQELPELLPLIQPVNMHYASPNWFENIKVIPPRRLGNDLELFLGGAGGKFPYAHIDEFHTNAWITQLYGDKNFFVFPRGSDEYMYPRADNKYRSPIDIFNPDYEKYPKFRQATRLSVTVNAGETMFIPFGLWHSAESLTPSISIIFDQINNLNYNYWLQDIWDEKSRESKAKAMAICSYLVASKVYFRVKDAFTVH